MTEVSGGASAPPRLRDRRGRFKARNDTELLAEFLRRGIVQFKDPFHTGLFTMELGKSMKNFPVRLYHSHHKPDHDLYEGGAWHRCTGSFKGYDQLSPYGRQLAISPETFYGWPEDKWSTDQSGWTVEGMASLLIHLALTVDLKRLGCGDTVDSRRPR